MFSVSRSIRTDFGRTVDSFLFDETPEEGQSAADGPDFGIYGEEIPEEELQTRPWDHDAGYGPGEGPGGGLFEGPEEEEDGGLQTRPADEHLLGCDPLDPLGPLADLGCDPVDPLGPLLG